MEDVQRSLQKYIPNLSHFRSKAASTKLLSRLCRHLASTIGLLVLSLGIGSTCASSLDEWQRRDKAPPEMPLSGVAFGNGVYVTVGWDTTTKGTLMRSLDGSAWEPVELIIPSIGTNPPLKSVAFGNGRFVAVGPGGCGPILTSDDGLVWSRQTSPVCIGFTRVAYCGDRFLATGGSGYLFASTNGLFWTQLSLGANSGAQLVGLCYGQGKYVATGAGAPILTSTNGTDWTAQTPTIPGYLFGVTFGQNTFVAVGQAGMVFTSSNAVNWVMRNPATSADLYDITFGSGKFVATGYYNTIVRSDDGISWTPCLSSDMGQFSAIVRAPDRFVAVGKTLIDNTSGTIATSADGLMWTTLYGSLGGVAYGNSRFVAVGELGSCRTSSDGISWTNETTGISNRLRSVTFGNNTFVAAGDKGGICSSTNGSAWVGTTLGTNSFRSVAFGNGSFVAVGERGSIATSTNALDWQLQQFPSTSIFYGVGYGKPGFVAVGNFVRIVHSDDGIQWQAANPPMPFDSFAECRSVAYGNDTFVIVVNAQTNLSSSDGLNWTPHFCEASGGANVVFANGRFVGVTFSGTIFSSTDGGTWVKGSDVLGQPLGIPHGFTGIGYGNGSFITVASDSRIMQSGPILSLKAQQFSPETGLELSLIGQSGRVYQIQASPDLTNWSYLFAITNTAPTTNFRDANATNLSTRFYRAILP
jgi:hypothetical protein